MKRVRSETRFPRTKGDGDVRSMRARRGGRHQRRAEEDGSSWPKVPFVSAGFRDPEMRNIISDNGA